MPVICMLLGGCASSRKTREAELLEIAAWLPGVYDNTAQIEADKRQGAPAHEPLAIALVPVYAPVLSQNVFYAQEMAADNARRVMSQRLFTFDITEDEQIVQSVWTLTEPLRWRDAHLNPDLFKSIQPPDVHNMPGCELRWKKAKDGGRYTAEGSRQSCRSKALASGGGSLFVEMRMELTPDELAMSDQLYDAKGKLVSGRPDEPFYRFRRRAAE